MRGKPYFSSAAIGRLKGALCGAGALFIALYGGYWISLSKSSYRLYECRRSVYRSLAVFFGFRVRRDEELGAKNRIYRAPLQAALLSLQIRLQSFFDGRLFMLSKCGASLQVGSFSLLESGRFRLLL